MITAVRTLAAIDKHIEDRQENGHRAHLGASLIGEECSRAIWYKWRWVLHEVFAGRMLRLFQRGHEEEKVFIQYLRNIGCTIWEKDPATGKQFRVEDCDGHFGGSLDAVGIGLPDLPPDEPFYAEFKTHNDKSFKQLKEQGVMRSKWKHFVQFQTYMFKNDIKWGLYCAVNKNDDEIFMQLFQLDNKTGPDAIKRAESIIWAEGPPPRIGATPAAYGCKFCLFQRLCHFGDVEPDRNCRTCEFSSPHHEGEWYCNLHEQDLTEKDQIAGCSKYTVREDLKGRQP